MHEMYQQFAGDFLISRIIITVLEDYSSFELKTVIKSS